jgi:predicted membrane protein
MEDNKIKFTLDAKVILGLVVIAMGVIFLLENLGYIEDFNFWEFWPVVPIMIGLSMLGRPPEVRQPLGGIVLITVGVLFLLHNLDIIPWNIGDFWPVFVILVGLIILKGAFFRSTAKGEASTDYVSMSMVLGGGDFKFETKNFKGGKIDAIMGGGTIDLRKAEIQEDEVTLDAFALWGGIELKVPEHWQVTVHGTPLLGGIDNKVSHVPAEGPSKKLTIRATAIMGGVEIRN